MRSLNQHHRRAAAMVELCLALPILVSIIVAIFFTGWVMVNHQHVRVSDRYIAWKNADGTNTSTDEINEKFFEDKGRDVDIDRSSGPADNLTNFVEEINDQSGPAFGLADEMLFHHFPQGEKALVSARFPFQGSFWLTDRFNGTISRSHTRDGGSWQRGQCSPVETITNQYLSELNQGLNAVNAPGQNFANVIRNLYRNSGGGW